MGITYRQGNEGRLTVSQMDDNFHYLEDQLAGLTQSNSDRLVSPHQSKGGNDLEVVLDNKGTLNTPLLLPTDIWTATCDYYHKIGTYDFDNTNLWEFHFKFEVSQDGIVSTMVDNPFPIETNPGYLSGDSFRFTEADHGIPDFIFDVQLDDVVHDYTGWTANLAVTEAPEYPSTIKSLGAVKITANDKSLTFGTNGSLTFPDYSVQTTAYKPTYKVFTALLTQNGTYNNIGLFYGTTTIGVSYTIIEDGPLGTGYDFTVIGAPNNDIGTSFIATGTTPVWGTNGAVGLSYNVGAPVAIVLENTIGNIWFTYNTVGTYNIYSDSLFIINKTITFTTTSSRPSEPYWITTKIGNSEEIYLFQFDGNGNYHNDLQSTSIEIRVYN